MGVIYYLCRQDNRTFFELGRGPQRAWFSVFHGEEAGYLSRPIPLERLEAEPLYFELVEAMADLDYGDGELDVFSYSALVARGIEEWAWGSPEMGVYLTSDAHDYFEMVEQGWRTTASRYTGFDPEQRLRQEDDLADERRQARRDEEAELDEMMREEQTT